MLLLTDSIKETILRTTKAKDKGNNEFMGLCPVHGDSKPSLSIKIDGNKALFNCFSGCDHNEIENHFKKIKRRKPKLRPDQVKKINAILNESVKIQKDSIAYKYLVNRGISYPLRRSEAKFHPSLDVFDGEQVIQLPAIVFVIRDENNKIKGLQRVYLGEDGAKGNIADPKRVIGTIKQNAIKFGNLKDELHLAEGPETAIAIYKALKRSVWCCINATNLSCQVIPKTVSKVHIWADKDKSETGQREAIKAADKYHKDGFEVFIHYPPSEIEKGSKSVDWLDEFNKNPETLKQLYCNSIPYPWKKIKQLGATSSVSVDFSPKLIPKPLRGWINEVSELMNVRPEIVTTPMIIALSSLIGRQVAIRPKKHDFTFEVIPNLWGAIVADPGSKKSPAVNMALAPINELVKNEKEKFKDALKEFAPIEQRINLEIDSLNKRYNSKAPNKITAQELVEETQKLKDELEEQRPVEKRYITNDSTIEKLVEILRDNPNGLMISKNRNN